MKIKLSKEDLELINRALMRQRWHVEEHSQEGQRHPDFRHTDSLMEKLSLNFENGVLLVPVNSKI